MAPALDLFRGDSRGEKPHYWLKKLQGTMSYDTKDEARLYRFEMGLAPGTTAEKWWEQLDRKEKATWADLMTAFKKKWPVPKEAVETPEELRGRIKSTILRSEDLGKLVGPPGDEMYAHLRWAADMRPLVETINDPTMLLKSDVRATLPLEVRATLPRAGLTTWEKFFDAIETLDSEAIQDELERSGKHKRHGFPDISREIDAFDPDGTSAELHAHITALRAAMPDSFDALMLSPQTRHTASAPAPRMTYTRATHTSTPQQHTPALQYQNTSQQYRQTAHPVTPQRAAPPHMPQMQYTSPGNPFAPSPYQGPTTPTPMLEPQAGTGTELAI
ncbi:hypothetical protein B0H10DRAFT_260315 [Mycena sp. CBHHK59/15]|nr:hypothetical protein B0H10DRAFT_260315 [Mycena sp. CBHHK59/15]